MQKIGSSFLTSSAQAIYLYFLHFFALKTPLIQINSLSLPDSTLLFTGLNKAFQQNLPGSTGLLDPFQLNKCQ
jgi:hypothetical protein